jgi:hypothetical protein
MASPPKSIDPGAVEAEIERIRLLGTDAVRQLWRTTFRSLPPKSLSRDILGRMLAWHLQEQAYGGVERETVKLLDDLVRGEKTGGRRRLKAGAVLVREYQGERHTVTVVPNGFLWQEKTYSSLSTIARAITGTAWNGPRFFGLRAAAEKGDETPAAPDGVRTSIGHRAEVVPAAMAGLSRARRQVERESPLPGVETSR